MVIDLWEVLTGKLQRRLPGHPGGTWSVAFSPDGKLMASGGSDDTVLVREMTAPLHSGKGSTSEVEHPRLESLWADLGSSDAARAYEAECILSRVDRQAVRFLKGCLRTAPEKDPRKLARLIAELDDQDFQVRERAMAELTKLGKGCAPVLRRALAASPSAEARRRIQQLLARPELSDAAPPPPEELRALRGVAVLEHIATPEARQVLEGLSKGAAGTRLTQESKASLERLDKKPPATLGRSR